MSHTRGAVRWFSGIALGFVVGCVLSSGAQQAEPPSRMEEYLRASGMHQALEKQRADVRAATSAQSAQLLEQISEAAPDLPPAYMDEVKAMVKDMEEAVANAYTVDEALAVYARAWDRAYPGADLDRAMAQLSTPDGQKLSATISTAIAELSQFTLQRRQTVMNRESAKIAARFRELVRKMRSGELSG